MNIIGTDTVLIMPLLVTIPPLVALVVLMDKEIFLRLGSRLGTGNILYEQVALNLLISANPAKLNPILNGRHSFRELYRL